MKAYDLKGTALLWVANKYTQLKGINGEGGTPMNDRLLWILIFSAFLFILGIQILIFYWLNGLPV